MHCLGASPIVCGRSESSRAMWRMSYARHLLESVLWPTMACVKTSHGFGESNSKALHKVKSELAI